MATFSTGWGPQDSVQLPYKWLISMVYGRYNERVNSSLIVKKSHPEHGDESEKTWEKS